MSGILHWSVEIFFEEDKEESLNEAVHGAADEHHDEEEEDLHVGQDRLQPPHRVLWTGNHPIEHIELFLCSPADNRPKINNHH